MLGKLLEHQKWTFNMDQ